MEINDMAVDIHEVAKLKGFWDNATITFKDPVTGDVEGRVKNPSIIGEKLALVHSEVSEALEANRDGNGPLFAEELADVVIRVLDLAEHEGIDMEREITTKMRKNADRPRLHGRNW